MSVTTLGPHYPIDHSIGKPTLASGNTTITEGKFYSPSYFPSSEFRHLLEGDQQTGGSHLLLEGDQQTGSDVLSLEGVY